MPKSNDLEAEAVRTCPSWPGGKDATVVKFDDGSYQLWSRRDNEVETGRLSAELDVLLFEKIPWSVHNGLSQMRYLVETESKARLMAKVAFEANGAGRPGLALGLLEAALNEGLEHPALSPSREALLKKGIVAESVAKSLLAIYQTEESWARPDRRVSLDTARRQAREFALARLGRSTRVC